MRVGLYGYLRYVDRITSCNVCMLQDVLCIVAAEPFVQPLNHSAVL